VYAEPSPEGFNREDANVIPLGKHIILLSLALSVCAPLAAQDRDVVMEQINLTKQFLLKQRLTPDYRSSIRESILAYENSLDTHCKDVALDFDSVDVRDRILAVLETDDKGTAVAGAWRESIPGAACNEKRKFTVQVVVTRQGLRFTTTFPGEADGDPELQHDTLKNIEMDLQILRLVTRKSCHLEVIDTHLVGERATLQDNGLLSQWKELWDVRACGTVYAVPITFIPDKSGTSISVAASAIHAE